MSPTWFEHATFWSGVRRATVAPQALRVTTGITILMSTIWCHQFKMHFTLSNFDTFKAKDAYNTRDSQAVTHPSTNRARRCLTSVIRREPVCSTWYGRRHRNIFKLWLVFTIPTFLGSIVVSIRACHARDRGSIPRRGGNFLGFRHECFHFTQ